MIRINAAICDDEPMALNMVSSALTTCFAGQGVNLELEQFTSPIRFKEHISGHSWQVVFLDIDMPEIDGITLGKEIKKADPHTDIIYISNCEDRVFDSFSTQPFGFVRKSSFLKDAESVATLYVASLRRKESIHYLEVKSKNGISRLKIADITYIECIKDTQIIHLAEKDTRKEVPVQLRMKVLEEKLGDFGFLRIHTGYLVNYQFIQRIEEESVQLQGGETLPISRRKRHDIFQAYMKLSRDKSV